METELIRRTLARLASRFDRRYWLLHAEAGTHVEELWRALGDEGFLGVTVPEEYGGSGLSVSRLAVVAEALAEHGIPTLFLIVSTAMGAIPLVRHGTDEQKRRFLPGLASGASKFAFALTEADAGSNSFRLKTSARQDGDAYVLSGQKAFISGADAADHLLVVARDAATPEGQRPRLSLFIVPRDAPGIELHAMDIGIVGPERQFMVFLDEVRVPAANRLGGEGAGLATLFDALNPERIVVAATAVGLGRFALAKAIGYARQREVFGAPIGTHQGIAHPLALARTHLELAALMAHRSAAAFDAGEDAGMYANMAKMAAADAALEAVDTSIQVMGGSGFTKEADLMSLWPLVRLFKTAPVSREMILNYIGEHVLGLPRSYAR
jgi:alkylation response protein AidB-like acyl-CoA dehydrogenase